VSRCYVNPAIESFISHGPLPQLLFPPTTDLRQQKCRVVSQSHNRQPKAASSSDWLLEPSAEIEVESESRPAGRGPKRKRDAEKGDDQYRDEEREEERASGQREGETRKRKEPPALPPRVAPQPTQPAISTPKITPQSALSKFVRDKQYYHESGDLAFVVEDVLFKVNAFAISQPLHAS